MPDIEKLSTVLFDAVQDYVRRSFEAFSKRQSDALEAKLAEFRQPKDGEPGPAGKDADPGELVEIRTLAEGAAKRADATFDELMMTDENVEKLQADVSALKSVPAPKDGEPGPAGPAGKDVDPAALGELRASVSDMLKQAEAALDSGLVELAAAVAAAKALPIAPASMFIDDKGELVAVYPDGSTKSVGMVRGKDGARGASIMDGSVNAAGELGFRLSDGRVLNVGAVRGEAGKPGESKIGPAGKDAIEVRILPTIDESKSYPEGTCAAYRGGTIRADRTTDPVEDDILKAGWRVILDGIAEETEHEIDEGRFVERTTIYTSGKSFTRKTVTRAMVYRGIWTDKEFLPGDTATWDGSLWHCENQTRDKPGLSPNWKLVAKRGRDGKDATKH